MREGALFGTMFGLGAGAVLAGVTVSRLVIGQAPEKPAAGPTPVAVEAALPAVSSAAPPPAEVASPRQRRASPRRHLRAPVEEETPAATTSVPNREAESAPPPLAEVGELPMPQEHRSEPSVGQERRTLQPPPLAEQAPFATASVPSGEAETAVPRPVDVGDVPIEIVRGGAAPPRPGAHAFGPRIIQVDPQDDAR